MGTCGYPVRERYAETLDSRQALIEEFGGNHGRHRNTAADRRNPVRVEKRAKAQNWVMKAKAGVDALYALRSVVIAEPALFSADSAGL